MLDHEPTIYSLKFLDLIDTRARYLGLETLVIGDEYLFIKDAYFQNREYDTLDGEVEDDFDKLFNSLLSNSPISLELSINPSFS